jgi:hypothetical protein
VFKLTRADRRLLAVSEHGAAYTADRGGVSSLVWTDFDSGAVRQIDASDWEIEQVEADDQWLTWVEQEQEQSDGVQPVSWRIKALRLGTGRVETVLSSRTKSPLAPGIALWQNTLFYSLYRGIAQGTSDFHARDLSSGSDRVVVRDIAAGQMVYDGSRLISTMTVSRGSGPGQSRTDLFTINRTPSQRITDTGHGVDPQLFGGRLLWQSCIEARCAVMVQDWPTGKARELLTTDDPIPFLGDGFFTMMGNREGYPAPLVVPLDSPDRILELTQPPDQHLDGVPLAHGDKVAWLTFRGDDEANSGSLVVATVAVK